MNIYEVSNNILITEEQVYQNIRNMRNSFLDKSDWTQMPDSPLSTSKKQEWAEYRQALRDIPETFPNLREVVWPVKPA